MKKILFYFLCLLHGQNTYQGQVAFEYNGTESGVFSSTLQDSTISGFSLNQTDGDSSSFLIASVTQQDDNEFDLFLAVLQDTNYPLQPRIWDIPGEGDENNPLSLESLVIFLPGLDSSIVDELFDIFTNSAAGGDSTDILTDLFTSLSSNLYLGLDGEIEIESVTDSSIIGSFNTVLIKPAFYFPPHTISIDNGEFQFFDIGLPVLNSTIEANSFPDNFEISSIYPNPFNSTIKIELNMSSNSVVAQLYIINVRGQKIETIFNGNLESGKHNFRWNSGANPSGIYFSVLETFDKIITRKLMLIK